MSISRLIEIKLIEWYRRSDIIPTHIFMSIEDWESLCNESGVVYKIDMYGGRRRYKGFVLIVSGGLEDGKIVIGAE